MMFPHLCLRLSGSQVRLAPRWLLGTLPVTSSHRRGKVAPSPRGSGRRRGSGGYRDPPRRVRGWGLPQPLHSQSPALLPLWRVPTCRPLSAARHCHPCPDQCHRGLQQHPPGLPAAVTAALGTRSGPPRASPALPCPCCRPRLPLLLSPRAGLAEGSGNTITLSGCTGRLGLRVLLVALTQESLFTYDRSLCSGFPYL